MIFLKIIIFITFLFFASHASSTNSNVYTPIPPSSVQNSHLIQDLLKLGAEYTLQKAIFRQPYLIPNGSWKVVETESVSTRTSGNFTYYKYVVQIRCESTPFLIKARYIVSFIPTNGNTKIQHYCYKILNKYPDGPIVAEAPSFVDFIWLTKESEVYAFLHLGINYVLFDVRDKNLLTDPTYELKRVFRIHNISNSTVKGYSYLIQVGAQRGYNWRFEITVYDNYDSSEPLNPTYTLYPNALRS